MGHYNTDFYKEQQEGSRRSANEIIPLVLELIQPNRVIDIGCGIGTWLSVFKEYGIEDFLGVDGEYVDKKMLQIPEDHFIAFDLRKPLRIENQFDLVISLEVAEHSPSVYVDTYM